VQQVAKVTKSGGNLGVGRDNILAIPSIWPAIPLLLVKNVSNNKF
jgi:hypothetical protein